MATAHDGKPRSENRRSSYQVHVRLTAEEWEQLQTQVESWNRHLPPGASASARMTIARLVRTAALRRKRPAALFVLGETLTELKTARADLARLGNILKTWLEYGDGVFNGKGHAPLAIHRPPYGGELSSIRDALKAMTDTAERITRLIEPGNK